MTEIVAETGGTKLESGDSTLVDVRDIER